MLKNSARFTYSTPSSVTATSTLRIFAYGASRAIFIEEQEGAPTMTKYSIELADGYFTSDVGASWMHSTLSAVEAIVEIEELKNDSYVDKEFKLSILEINQVKAKLDTLVNQRTLCSDSEQDEGINEALATVNLSVNFTRGWSCTIL